MSTPFEAYCKYLALKQHFSTDSYDYFKYHGKVSAKYSAFERRHDRMMFGKLAKHPDLETFLLASILDMGAGAWIGDILEAEDAYVQHVKKIQSLSHVFKEDLGKLNPDFDSNFVTSRNSYPEILQLALGKHIEKETCIILDTLLSFSSYWEKKGLVTDPLWLDTKRVWVKYAPFFLPRVDLKKMKRTIFEKFA